MSGPLVTVRLSQTLKIQGSLIRNRATRHSRRQDCGAKYYICTPGSSFKIILVQDHRTAGLDRSSSWCGTDFWLQFLGLLRMVDLADSLPQQVARLGQKDSCGV